MAGNLLNVVSFNCQGVKSVLPCISDLCSRSHLVFLQETWLLPSEVCLLNDVHPSFNSCSVSSINVSERILVGRPYGGISILYHKNLTPFSQIIQYDDDRLLGISVRLNGAVYLFINVYLTYFCDDNYSDYVMYMGKLASILDGSDAAGVVILGDFNAHPVNGFYAELEELCIGKDLIISDVQKLPGITFTHINQGSLTKSWLDHCVSSSTLHESIIDISVDNNYLGSDHFPLRVSFELGRLPENEVTEPPREEKVNWNFSDPNLRAIFYSILSHRFVCDFNHPAFACSSCDHMEHRCYLEEQWEFFITIVESVGREVFGTLTNKRKGVPGWNSHVRDLC